MFEEFRESLLENFAGDLEYHPRRAKLYLSIAAIILMYLYLSSSNAGFQTLRLFVGLGSVTLALKGIFLLRKSSEGLALTEQQLASLSDPANRKSLPSFTNQAAQIVQDFGAGPFLLGPLLMFAGNMDEPSKNSKHVAVALLGAAVFFLGWLIRRLSASRSSARPS